MWKVNLPDPAATRAFGEALGRVAAEPVVVALIGGLGAGKTSLAQGVGDGLGVTAAVVSPTFILVAEYPARLPLLHADLYRIEADELLETGLEESLEGWPGVALVEWADRFPGVLPLGHLACRLVGDVDGGREARIAATGGAANRVLVAWQDAWHLASQADG
jgi:tRNA threonylcarbamoyladenosine biosynthesis protein TsaE